MIDEVYQRIKEGKKKKLSFTCVSTYMYVIQIQDTMQANSWINQHSIKNFSDTTYNKNKLDANIVVI